MSKFVKLDEELLSSDAWGFLTAGAKALYIELKRQFTGSNNGQIFLSHRDAAHALNMHRNTIGKLYREIEAVGLIVATKPSKIGPSGVGQSTTWQLTELPMPAPKKEKPKRKFNKAAPPKFTPSRPVDDDDLVLDDEVKF